QVPREVRRLAALRRGRADAARARRALVGTLAPDRLRESAGEGEGGMIPTTERARGRWREILPVLGIAATFLRNRHGPCPLCGGKDRFRFDDKNGDGTYFCNQCGAGTGVILVRKRHRWDHATACSAIDDIIGREHRP